MIDKRKKSFYLPNEILDVLMEEAEDKGISVSKVVQDCVKLVLANLPKLERAEGTTAFSDRIGRKS